jgi:hypothetical protein
MKCKGPNYRSAQSIDRPWLDYDGSLKIASKSD